MTPILSRNFSQPLQGESFVNNYTETEDGARLDIKANRIGLSLCENFHSHAKTSRKLHNDAYKYHETLRNYKHQQRILKIEQSSFRPLIFGCTGGAAPTATRTMQRLAEKLSEKRQESYPESINYIRTKKSFALVRSSILCIRVQIAAQSSIYQQIFQTLILGSAVSQVPLRK